MNSDIELYINLNNAIWKQAVNDDFKGQKARLFYEITEQVFNVLVKYDKEKRDTYSKISKIVVKEYGATAAVAVKELEKEIKNHYEDLKKSVQMKVYRESLIWPNNPRNRKDTEYEKEFRQIRDNILKLSNVNGVKEAE